MRFTKHWWVSLQPFTGSDSDYAFFCQGITDPLTTRLVVHAAGTENPWKDCRSVVALWRDTQKPWLPLDLEVIYARTRFPTLLDLSRWRLVTTTGAPTDEYGSIGSLVNELVIDTSGQDTGTSFVCKSGSWYGIHFD